ncbi:MAG TPA: bifunctional riboflavin kinase/FAD synthetase [bacterium]|nr:bifunctional riboflavin kinase/FAD synthetase [bacterium]
MKVYRSSSKFPASAKNPVVALGNFDGVHQAHQKMFKIAIREARRIKGRAVAYTFDPHPVKVLSQVAALPMINTLKQKLELMAETGLDAAVVEPFELKFAHLGAEEWFQKIVVKRLHAAGVVVGYDFTFGSRRSGTVEVLERLCAEAGIFCRVMEAQLEGEALISSTQIRAFVAKGEVEYAARLLGRWFFVDGTVIRGAGRGASLGFPTANLKTENELKPAPGVYACFAQVGRKKYRAVANLGQNPTFGGSALSLEAHLLNYKGNLYGKKLRLHFVKRLREERSFASAEDLVRQIRADIRHSQEILARS